MVQSRRHKKPPVSVPAAPTPEEICQALKKGIELERVIWGDTRFDLASRLAYRWFEISRGSGHAFLKLQTMQQEMNAPERQINQAICKIVKRWRLFIQDPKDRFVYHPNYEGRPPEEFKHHVQRVIPAGVAVVWVLRDLIWEKGMTTHTDEQFGEQLGHSLPTISYWLNQLGHRGYVRRFNGSGRNHPSIYVRPHLDSEIWNLEERYFEHYPTEAPRRTKRTTHTTQTTKSADTKPAGKPVPQPETPKEEEENSRYPLHRFDPRVDLLPTDFTSQSRDETGDQA